MVGLADRLVDIDMTGYTVTVVSCRISDEDIRYIPWEEALERFGNDRFTLRYHNGARREVATELFLKACVGSATLFILRQPLTPTELLIMPAEKEEE